MTMDVINYYLYGRSELNYDSVGNRNNLKVGHDVYNLMCLFLSTNVSVYH
jgi:hypothetical protein